MATWSMDKNYNPTFLGCYKCFSHDPRSRRFCTTDILCLNILLYYLIRGIFTNNNRARNLFVVWINLWSDETLIILKHRKSFEEIVWKLSSVLSPFLRWKEQIVRTIYLCLITISTLFQLANQTNPKNGTFNSTPQCLMW